jgi:hypothetical protein
MPAQPELFLAAQAVDIAGFSEVERFHKSKEHNTPARYLSAVTSILQFDRWSPLSI